MYNLAARVLQHEDPLKSMRKKQGIFSKTRISSFEPVNFPVPERVPPSQQAARYKEFFER